MYTIGEFSVMSGIAKKTLRYYDDIDLLNPMSINENNGYRLYDEKQLRISSYIKQYKNLGLSLDEIRTILNTNEEECHSILQNRLKMIEVKIGELKEQKKDLKRQLKLPVSMNRQWKEWEIGETILEEGYVYTVSFASDVDIHDAIGEFYNSANQSNIVIENGHMICKDVSNIVEDEGFALMAYTNRTSVSKGVRRYHRKMGYSVVCKDIRDKEDVYKSLIDYFNHNGMTMVQVVEQYSMSKGKLTVKLIGLTE